MNKFARLHHEAVPDARDDNMSHVIPLGTIDYKRKSNALSEV